MNKSIEILKKGQNSKGDVVQIKRLSISGTKLTQLEVVSGATPNMPYGEKVMARKTKKMLANTLVGPPVEAPIGSKTKN